MESVISSPLLYNLALTLIHFIWQGCIIALALKFLLLITPHQKSRTRYALSAAAMLACLIVPITTYFAIYQPSFNHITNQSDQITQMMVTANLASNHSITWYQSIFDALPYVSILWFSVVTILATKLFIELYNVNQLPKIGTTPADSKLQQRFEELVKQINLNKTPRLLISLKTDIPMAMGWLKPVILIPTAMLSGLTPAQLDMLILHELAHIRRHDYLVNFFQTLVETLLFFHPAVRWVSKQMRNEREYCSDDIAVNVSGNPIAYAHTLADTASLCSKHLHKHRSHAIPNMAMAASGGDLKQRVVRLVDQHHCSSNDDSGKFLASILIIFSICLVAIKPYLNASIIDFTSGRISLFKTANDIIQQKPANAANLSATSIAQMLLQQEKSDDKTQQVTNNTIINSNVPPKALDKVQAKTIIPKQKELKLDNKNIAITNKNQNSIVQQKKIKLTAATPPVIKQIEKKSQTESLLAKPQEKSISELAFERTDSSNKKSTMKNPYSTQVASLINEPIVNNEPQKISDFAFPTDKKAQPRYTITAAKKTEVINKKPIKKSAEILRSPDPKYPSTATRRGIEMDITVNFTIDTDGIVRDITFEQKSKVSYFRSAIRNAMAKWRFLPAQLNGQPIESKMTKIFSFSLAK